MLKSAKSIIFIALLAILCFAGFNFALAQSPADPGNNFGSVTMLSDTDPRIIIARIIQIALGFLGIIAVILIIYAGWLYMTAAGEQEKIDRAKKILAGGVIGLIIILSSFAIASFVLNKLYQATGGTSLEGPVPPSTGDEGGDIGGGDTDETLINCDGNTGTPECEAGSCPAGNYCETGDCSCHKKSDLGETCSAQPDTCQADDSRCGELLKCDPGSCKCIGAPIIDSISPNNGAAANFITIKGRYFGAERGHVYFYNAGKPDMRTEAQLASDVNPDCANSWNTNQIIAVVPADAQDGIITLEREDGQFDDSGNTRGAIFDFDVNAKIYPGICEIDPGQGKFNDTFYVAGHSLSGSDQAILFGTYEKGVSANSSGWTPNSAKASVPDITVGNNSLYAKVGTQNSNYLDFNVLYDTNQPVIQYVSPSQGAAGQYITIYGKNFGSFKSGTSKVQFWESGNPFNADVDFPKECQNAWWHENYIVVKVPDTGIFDLANLVVTNGNNKKASTDFMITEGQPGPGLCSLVPGNGSVGQNVTAYGDNFGNEKGQIRVYPNLYNSSLSAWANNSISFAIPAGAKSGPVEAIKEGQVSNGLPFSVGTCSNNSQCQSGQECCGAGSNFPGLCKEQGKCGSAESFTPCSFTWTFSTTPKPALTCGGYTSQSACAGLGMCPNSPGQCVSNSANSERGDCSDSYCSQQSGCALVCNGTGTCDGQKLNQPCRNGLGTCISNCSYDPDLNRCKLNSSNCDLPQTVSGFNGAECRNDRWEIQIKNVSCPAGSEMSLESGWCVIGGNAHPQKCNSCGSGFKCQNNADSGVCVIDKAVCPSGSTCDATGKCVQTNASCNCCCRVANSAQDCCAGLTCTSGGCGSDNPSFGACTGCKIMNGAAVDQNASNKACNCSNSKYKYCETSDPAYPNGICKDQGEPGAGCSSSLNSCIADDSRCTSGKCGTDCKCEDEAQIGDPCKKGSKCTAGTDNCGKLECDESSCTCQEPKPAGPAVKSWSPSDDAVCRNAIMEIEFDQEMKSDSYANNFLLLGDYGPGPCPSGTKQFGEAEKKISLLNKLIFSIKKIFVHPIARIFGKNALAEIPDPTHKYCQIAGTINGNKNEMTFTPSSLLESEKIYFAVTIASSTKPIQSAKSIPFVGNNSETFNGKAIEKAKIWSFKTSKTVCAVASVDVNPESALLNQSGQTMSLTATAKAANNNEITPNSGVYDWAWSWDTDNQSVAKIDSSAGNTAVIKAGGLNNSLTFIRPTAKITVDKYFKSIGQEKSGRAQVYIFLCQNPWPAINPANSSWSPWKDEANNCTVTGSGSCADTGYEFYYCRDDGEDKEVVNGQEQPKTTDDLPSITGTILRSASDVLKESYFFRAEN